MREKGWGEEGKGKEIGRENEVMGREGKDEEGKVKDIKGK